MKFTPALAAISLFASAPLTMAADAVKPDASKATDKESTKAEGADDAWAGVEAAMKKRPTSLEEAKEFIAEFDEKSAAFLKDHPNDARRWKIKGHEIQVNQLRGRIGLKPKSDEEIRKTISEILEAKDADKDTKATASYVRVMWSSDDQDEFRKLAAAHKKDFPDFKGNSSLDSQLKTMDTEKSIKEKPLELSFTSTDGREINLSSMRGKVVLVDFWATWCGPCVAEIPNVVGSYKKLHDKGFEIVGISFDQDKGKLEKMTKEKEMTWPQYFDGKGWSNEFGKQFGINSIPRMWLVNKKGMVVDTNGRANLEEKVAKLLAE